MYTDYEDDNESYYSDDDNNNSQNGERIKKIAIFILIAIILIVLVLILVKGCSKNNSNNNNNSTGATVKTLTPTIMIGRETLSLDVGEEFELQADVLNTKNTNPIITWRSDNTSVASVNDEGFIKAEGEGVTAIIASYRENNKTYTNACVVTVSSNVVKLESIKLSQKSIDLKKGNTFLIEVSTNPTDAKVDKFIFESGDNNIVTVNEKGYILAVSAGTTTVTVKTEDESISETMSVNVSENKNTVTVIEPTGIEIVGFTNGLTVGKTTQAIFNISPNSATNKEVKWTSSNENVARVDKNGVVTGVGAGTCTIMASTYNNITAIKEITVSSNTISVDTVKVVGPTDITMKVGGTRYLYYTITPSNASNKKVAYRSSNPSVVFIDSNGIMAGVGVGTATITITTQDGGKTAVANVTVISATASGTSSSSSTSSSSTIPSVDNDTSYYSSYNYSTDSSTYSSTYNEISDDTTSYCNAYDIVSIKHNETGEAIVSTISFNNTKPFKKISQTPALEVIQLSDCVDSIKYTIYYGTNSDSVTTKVKTGKISKIGDKIKLEKGNGYYRIEVTGTTSDDTMLTKTYYAYVENSTKRIEVTSTYKNSKKVFTITKLDSKITRVYYCVSSKSDCSPSIRISNLDTTKTTYYGYISMTNLTSYNKTMTSGGYNKEPSISKGYKICFAPYNGNILITSDLICKYI